MGLLSTIARLTAIKDSAVAFFNQFEIISGALVGVNMGTISTSYVQSTNLINYSTILL